MRWLHFWKKHKVLLSYRIPMAVCEVCLFSDGNAFPVCPRCGLTLEREYQPFCDRCGQALDWKKFPKASIRTPPS